MNSHKKKTLKVHNRFEALAEKGKEVEEPGIKEVYAVEASEQECGMLFHMTDPKRMLASVDKITAAGNKVHFGPAPTENHVMNIKTKRKIPLKKRNGVCIMEVFFIDGDGKKISGEIIVDSGAFRVRHAKGDAAESREDGG